MVRQERILRQKVKVRRRKIKNHGKKKSNIGRKNVYLFSLIVLNVMFKLIFFIYIFRH